ncbi:hypothetical protein [Xanthomonas cannabis]|uniref:Uncharacterized protein n=1 Tax=Xanthomonas cannabis TaxID=1885674 RepID=A0ABR6JPU5_9XANT|nr:hypothetical protein [Xanthomonas cannabis]MBB4594845.1 hypothetical protein [Xanthomonas cannabis]MBB5523661.1 hypothetical protein [Xanthomonas cannabis]
MTANIITKELSEFKKRLGAGQSQTPAMVYDFIDITNLPIDGGDNPSPGCNFISMQSSGTLQVFYEQGNVSSAPIFEVWHNGGATETVQLGGNTFQVEAGDLLFYQLSNPASDVIKFGWTLSVGASD